jgi:hypothetical protein
MTARGCKEFESVYYGRAELPLCLIFRHTRFSVGRKTFTLSETVARTP